jgi:DegV family protein with EDD domain
MSKIALVTDSTAYIPTEFVKQYNITVVPQILIWGEQTLRDGVDISPEEFYKRLKGAKVLPTTSQVSMVTMQTVFQSLVDKDFDVLGIFLSAKFSGTIQSATQGKEAMGSAGEKVAIVDSQSTSMAMGFQVLAAARALENGASLKECVEGAKQGHKHTGLFFAVDTLEFLHRGGRIGGGARFIGSLLNMKPILAIQDGRVEGIERIRTKTKAQDRVLELVKEQVKGKTNVRIASLHANAPDEAGALLERAKQELNPIETISTEVSPVVGNHAGPGTVGLAYAVEM